MLEREKNWDLEAAKKRLWDLRPRRSVLWWGHKCSTSWSSFHHKEQLLIQQDLIRIQSLYPCLSFSYFPFTSSQFLCHVLYLYVFHFSIYVCSWDISILFKVDIQSLPCTSKSCEERKSYMEGTHAYPAHVASLVSCYYFFLPMDCVIFSRLSIYNPPSPSTMSFWQHWLLYGRVKEYQIYVYYLLNAQTLFLLSLYCLKLFLFPLQILSSIIWGSLI